VSDDQRRLALGRLPSGDGRRDTCRTRLRGRRRSRTAFTEGTHDSHRAYPADHNHDREAERSDEPGPPGALLAIRRGGIVIVGIVDRRHAIVGIVDRRQAILGIVDRRYAIVGGLIGVVGGFDAVAGGRSVIFVVGSRLLVGGTDLIVVGSSVIVDGCEVGLSEFVLIAGVGLR
jgi:hypothetical protein